MGDVWQTWVVSIVVIMAVGYAVWHVYKALRNDAEPCCGCEGCPLKAHGCHEKCGENHKNPDCRQKN